MTLHSFHNIVIRTGIAVPTSIVIPTDIVIPTGDSLSDQERESEWRDLVFAATFVECLS